MIHRVLNNGTAQSRPKLLYSTITMGYKKTKLNFSDM